MYKLMAQEGVPLSHMLMDLFLFNFEIYNILNNTKFLNVIKFYSMLMTIFVFQRDDFVFMNAFLTYINDLDNIKNIKFY